MSLPKSPYGISKSLPGTGELVLSLLPPGRQVLETFNYQYPLKLIAPDPHHSSDNQHVTIAFLLTYGGGLVGGDQIYLKVELRRDTRLALVTQGSTKIFKSPRKSVVSRQQIDVKVGAGAAVCYLPDPTQPFGESVYEQVQTFYVEPDQSSSLLALDWVSEGRRARGERWTLWSWRGRNEVRLHDDRSKGRLLFRDAVILDDDGLGGTGLVDKASGMGIFGTLIVYGRLFATLGAFLRQRFQDQPRIGAKNWTATGHSLDSQGADQASRQAQPDGLLWTAASIRGFVVVKFGARDVDAARRWLGGLLKEEGSVERLFGHQALLCVR